MEKVLLSPDLMLDGMLVAELTKTRINQNLAVTYLGSELHSFLSSHQPRAKIHKDFVHQVQTLAFILQYSSIHELSVANTAAIALASNQLHPIGRFGRLPQIQGDLHCVQNLRARKQRSQVVQILKQINSQMRSQNRKLITMHPGILQGKLVFLNPGL
jgi:hypothetical protein